ncbi:MAG: hypothetical protein U1E09_11560, partial [Methylococcales bacterium]|nr:hypothetical protein [Methylococcales bacterium]
IPISFYFETLILTFSFMPYGYVGEGIACELIVIGITFFWGQDINDHLLLKNQLKIQNGRVPKIRPCFE